MVKLTKLSKKLTHLVSYFQYWGLLKGQEIYICDQAPKNILYGIIRKKIDYIIYLWTFKLIYLTKWLQEITRVLLYGWEGRGLRK